MWCHSQGSITFNQHSPDADTVSKHLKKTTNCDITFAPQDILCYNSYKLHCSILSTLNKSQEGFDDALQADIKKWNTITHSEETNSLNKAILSAVIFVAENLVSQRATLLPLVCRVFLSSYCDTQPASSIKSIELILEVGEGSVKFTSSWLLNQLILYLNPYMSCKCVHMKFGTILYHKGGDIIVKKLYIGNRFTVNQLKFEKHSIQSRELFVYKT